MKKRFLKAFISMIFVLFIIWAAVISTVSSGSININESSRNNETISSAETKILETTILVTTEPQTETTKVITEEVIEPTTKNLEPAENDDVRVEIEKVEESSEIHTSETHETEQQSSALYSASQFMQLGVISWNGWRWTWYSERVLPGGGLNIPGRHADSSGYICDGNDYICLSSSSLSKGTVIATPFGKSGKVYDTGCASDTIDVYVNW